MFRIAIGFLLSLMLTSWIYNEVVYFVPEFQDLASTATEYLKIPTHDHWPDIMNGETSPRLKTNLNGAGSAFSGKRGFKKLFARLGIPTSFGGVRDVVLGRPGALKKKPGGIFEPLFSTFESPDKPVFEHLYSTFS